MVENDMDNASLVVYSVKQRVEQYFKAEDPIDAKEISNLILI